MTAHPPDVVPHAPVVDRARRWARTGCRGATVWFTGIPASGKSTLAYTVEAMLVAGGRLAYVLDGDNLRCGLNADLGFSPQDRAENVRRLGHVAAVLADAGAVALVAAVSPDRAARDAVRRIHGEAGLHFVEVHVATPLAVCEQRDPKGLYARARQGAVVGLTGYDAPYDEPARPELVLGVGEVPLERQAAAVVEHLERR
ncbi:MAG: adenylyl-sulfate kinase [Acidimicrobiales bacterium]